MFSTWTVQLMRLSWLFVLAAAVVVFVPFGAAHHHGPGQNKATVDDILDDPQHYVGEEVVLEGEIDHIYSTTTLAMEDDQDLIGDDQILIISVMPTGATPAAQTSTGAAASDDDLAPVPAVEAVRLVDGEYKEGKIVAATGTIRMFDRAALEQEFGNLDLGSATAAEFENKPVLLMGARQYAELKQKQVEQQAAVTPPAQPEAEVTEPAPATEPPTPEPEERAEAEPQEPAAEPEPTTEIAEALPRTASPFPALGLAGLLSLLAGVGLRIVRK